MWNNKDAQLSKKLLKKSRRGDLLDLQVRWEWQKDNGTE